MSVNPWVSPNFALIVFVCIIVFGIIFTFAIKKYEHYESSKFHIFLTIMSGMSIIVLMLFYYSVISTSQMQSKLFILQETTRFNNELSNSIFSEFSLSSKEIPNFVRTLCPLTITAEPTIDPITTQAQSVRVSLCSFMISIWQDSLVSNIFIDASFVNVVAEFLQWCTSDEFYQQWSFHSLNFAEKTVNFGNVLFKYARNIADIKDPQSYVNAAIELVSDNKF